MLQQHANVNNSLSSANYSPPVQLLVCLQHNMTEKIPHKLPWVNEEKNIIGMKNGLSGL